MSQTDPDPAVADPAPDTLAALLPASFIEGFIGPLFRRRETAEPATELLGMPLAYACARCCAEPAVDIGELRKHAAVESVIARRIRARVVALLDEIAGGGIECVAFKGFATALSVYPLPSYRAMQDVDLLFREQDIPRVAKFLAGRGFRTAVDPRSVRAWGVLAEASFAPVFPPDESYYLDVHRAVDERPAGDGLDFGRIFAAAQPVTTEWGRCLVPSHEHAFAIAALNSYRDYYGPWGIKSLFDACLLLIRFGERIDWREIEAVARRGRFVKRIVFFRELLAALGAGRAPVFEALGLAPLQRRQLAAAVRVNRELAGMTVSDARKLALEMLLLDSPLATLRLNWRRLRSIANPRIHYLPGVPAAGDAAP